MTPIQRLSIACLLLASAASLGACANRKAAALDAQVPDDFRTVQRAPLAIPPEYALRPPAPGEPRPQELDPEAAARAALTGPPKANPGASQGEQALIRKASNGADPNPQIKALVDDEQGDLAHKSKSFAELVMFWKPGDPQVSAAGANDATPLNAADEATRISSRTGGKAVTIWQKSAQRPQGRRLFKLPGL